MIKKLNLVRRVLILSFTVFFVFNSCSPTEDEILERALSVKKTANKKFKDKDYNEAIKAYTALLQFDHPEIEYEKAYMNRGGAYTRLGKYDEALKDLDKVERILASKDDAELKALLYFRYGKLYLVNRNYELSNYYYKLGAALEGIKDSYRMTFYYRLANNYKLVGNDSCFIYYRKVYENKEDTSPRTYSNNLGAICGAYMKIESDTAENSLSSMDSVRFYCEKYFNITEENKYYQSSYYLKKSKYYNLLGHPEKARENSRKSLEYYKIKEKNDPDYFNDLLAQHLILELNLNGDSLLAHEFHEFRDTTLSLRKKAAKVEELRQELQLTQKQKELAEAKTKNRNYLLLLLFAGAIVIVLYLRNQANKNKNLFLQSEKERIEEEHEKLDLLNVELVNQIKELEQDQIASVPLSEIEKIPVVFQLRNRTKCVLRQEEIEYIVWTGNIATLYTLDNRQYEVRDSIPQFFKRYLHPHLFIRANKSVVVRINAIAEMKTEYLTLKTFPNRKVEWGTPYKTEAEKLIKSLRTS